MKFEPKEHQILQAALNNPTAYVGSSVEDTEGRRYTINQSPYGKHPVYINNYRTGKQNLTRAFIALSSTLVALS